MKHRMGFVSSHSGRVAIRNDQGDKVGYLASVNGSQVFQGVDGQTIARIIRFKRQYVDSRLGAVGGAVMPPAWNSID